MLNKIKISIINKDYLNYTEYNHFKSNYKNKSKKFNKNSIIKTKFRN
jgi:hypothetical protein